MSKPRNRTCFQYLPQAGGDPELFQQTEYSMPNQLQNWLQLRVRHQRAIRNLHGRFPVHLYQRILCRLKLQLLQLQFPTMEDPNREKPINLLLPSGLSRQNLEVGK